MKSPGKQRSKGCIRIFFWIFIFELFLHGIYVSPYSDKGKRAKVFLMDTISGKDVKCEVKAYTFQSVPTAICTIDGININTQLVDLGYSKNVALD